ncbi:MAG: OmpH family outer membrane protein [Phycisphaerales bacterium]|nr:OmpH family outer membrane protein [Phycisphaerales bacterium]
MKKFFCNPIVATAAIAALTISASCNNKSNNTPAASTAGIASNSKIAYVNVDSLQAKYTFWKSEADAFTAEQARVESELQHSAQQLQQDYAALQQKAQAGSLSEAEGKAAQQRLGQMQQSLETRRATLGEQLQQKQMAFSEKLQKNIDEYLTIYNKDGKYDFIFSYSKSGPILFANKALDITDDVLKGLNEFKSSTASDTNKSK